MQCVRPVQAITLANSDQVNFDTLPSMQTSIITSPFYLLMRQGGLLAPYRPAIGITERYGGASRPEEMKAGEGMLPYRVQCIRSHSEQLQPSGLHPLSLFSIAASELAAEAKSVAAPSGSDEACRSNAYLVRS